MKININKIYELITEKNKNNAKYKIFRMNIRKKIIFDWTIY